MILSYLPYHTKELTAIKVDDITIAFYRSLTEDAVLWHSGCLFPDAVLIQLLLASNYSIIRPWLPPYGQVPPAQSIENTFQLLQQHTSDTPIENYGGVLCRGAVLGFMRVFCIPCLSNFVHSKHITSNAECTLLLTVLRHAGTAFDLHRKSVFYHSGPQFTYQIVCSIVEHLHATYFDIVCRT